MNDSTKYIELAYKLYEIQYMSESFESKYSTNKFGFFTGLIARIQYKHELKSKAKELYKSAIKLANEITMQFDDIWYFMDFVMGMHVSYGINTGGCLYVDDARFSNDIRTMVYDSLNGSNNCIKIEIELHRNFGRDRGKLFKYKSTVYTDKSKSEESIVIEGKFLNDSFSEPLTDTVYMQLSAITELCKKEMINILITYYNIVYSKSVYKNIKNKKEEDE